MRVLAALVTQVITLFSVVFIVRKMVLRPKENLVMVVPAEWKWGWWQ